MATWAIGQLSAPSPVYRSRRLRRQLLDLRADVLPMTLLFLLLVWMGFVALTLWH